MTNHKSEQVGLAVMECQTVHYGHAAMLNYMRSTTTTSIIGLGSVRKHGIFGHPFTFEQRKAMIVEIFGDETFKFLPLDDIDASLENNEWADYVFQKIRSIDLPAPTDYFSGSRIDAKWYEERFAPTRPIDSCVFKQDNAVAKVFERFNGQRLHLVERETSDFPSGRDIRFLIERRDSEWKRFIPKRLHSFIEANYPPHLRQAIRSDRFPNCQDHPVGTRLIGTWEPNVVLELKDDGKWRPLPKKDEKADFAHQRHASART